MPMTSGNWTEGVYSSDSHYSHKEWSGDNGKYGSNGLCHENHYSLGKEWENMIRVNPNYGVSCMGGSISGFAANFGANNELAVIRKIGAKVKSHQFMLPVALGEARESLSMMENAIRTVGGVVYDVRHGQMKDAAQKLGFALKSYKNDRFGKPVKGTTLQDRWLEFQWGVKPLIQDAQFAAVAFAKAQNKIVVRHKVQGHTINTVMKQTSVSPSLLDSLVPVVYKRRFRYYLSEEDNSRPPLLENLGASDVLSNAWELTHLSVVFDYFLPMGDYLAAIHTLPLLKGELWYTDSIECYFDASYSGTSPNLLGFSTSGGQLYVNRYQVAANAIAAYDIPMPEFVKLKEALNPVRFGNLLALTMSSAFGLKPPKKVPTWQAARAQHYMQAQNAYNRTI